MAYIIKDGKAIQVVTNDIKIPKNIIDKVDNNKHSKEIEDRLNESKSQKRLSDHVLKCNGIDRVDSSKGYTLENSVPCCKYCNIAKHTMTSTEFYAWVRRVYEFNFL